MKNILIHSAQMDNFGNPYNQVSLRDDYTIQEYLHRVPQRTINTPNGFKYVPNRDELDKITAQYPNVQINDNSIHKQTRMRAHTSESDDMAILNLPVGWLEKAKKIGLIS